MIYLAGPYWHDDVDVRIDRVDAYARLAKRLIAAGLPVYAPVVHGHFANDALPEVKVPEANWLEHGVHFLRSRKVDIMLVLELWGASRSKGLRAEIDACRANGIPIVFLRRLAGQEMALRTKAREGATEAIMPGQVDKLSLEVIQDIATAYEAAVSARKEDHGK